MPIDYDRIMLTYKKKPQAGSTNTVGSQNRTAVSTSQQGGGIDWDRIMQEYGMRTPKAGTGSTPPLERGIYAPKLPGGTLAVPARSAGRFQMAALSGGNGYTTEAYGESLKKRIAEINERLTIYANRGRILGQVATKADADAWTAQKKALENEYAAWERGMYAAGQEKALSALPDEDVKLLDTYIMDLYHEGYQENEGPFDAWVDMNHAPGFTGEAAAAYRTLTGKYGKEKLESLTEYRARQINAEIQASRNQKTADYASSGPWQGVAASAASVVTNALSAPMALPEILKRAINPTNAYETLDVNAPAFSAQNFTKEARGGVSNAILGGDPENASFGRQAGNLLYQTLMSGLDSAVAMTIGGKSANYLLGATAATNAMQDITERGGTLEQAVTGGIAAGVFECIFEKYSIGNFYKLKETANVRGIRDLLLNMGKSALVNASEEGATELANVLYDSIMLGDISNVSIRLRELMAAGMTESEAKRAMATELGAQIGESALSGALMGLFFGGVGSLENYVRGSRASSGSTGVNANTSTAHDDGPRPITLPTAEETMNRQAAQSVDRGEVRFSITTLPDGEQITVIDHGQDAFEGKSKASYSAIARKVLLEKFRGQILPLSESDLARFRASAAGEYAFPRTQYATDSAEYHAKMRAAPELDNLLATAEYSHWAKDTKNHPEATLGFDYYKTKFVVDGHLFEGLINIANSEKGRVFYDITKIKEIPDTSGKYVAHLARPSSTFGNLSDPTISQPDTGVNPSIRNRNTIDTRTGPRPITLPTAAETMNRQAAHADAQYSLEEIDGRIMPVIDTKNDTRKFDAAETYLKTLVDTQNPFATILSDAQPVYIGKGLPGEYRSSENTKGMNVILRRVKMQAATNLDEMLLLAENGEWRENVKAKHSKDAANGWYRYDTEFAIPGKNIKGEAYNAIYSGTLLIRNDADGKSYLYDLLDIKEKKTVAAPASSTAKRRSEVSERVPSSTTESANTAPSSDTAKMQSELNESIRSSSDSTISQVDTGVNPSIRNRNTIDTVAGLRPITLPTAAETMNRQSVQQTQPPLPQVPGMLPTAEQDMTWRRARNAGTELERSGIEIETPGLMLPRTELVSNDRALDRQGTGLNIQEENEGGLTYAGAENLFDGSRKRDAGEGSGGQTGVLGEGTTGNQRRKLQARRAIERQNRVNALRQERVSAVSLGIAKGTDHATVTLMPEHTWDGEMISTAARIREESGREVVYFTGRLQLETVFGTKYAQGAIVGEQIYIQADNARYTVDQLGDHELYHQLARNNRGLIFAIREAITEKYGVKAFQKTVDRYMEAYSGIYEGGNVLNQILEEIFADAYAGMNAFNAQAPMYADTVRQITEERTGATPISTRGEAETRAGPGRVRNAAGGDADLFSIGYTTDNVPFVEVTEDVLAGVPKSEWVKTVKENLKQKFPDGITIGNNEINIDYQSRNEMTFSKYMRWLYNNDAQLHTDKLRAMNNADEILHAATDWVSEGLYHPRKDNITDFARGDVLLRVGGNDYTAEVVVGTRKNGRMILYDVLNLQPTSFTQKETDAAIAENPSPGTNRNTASISSDTNISQDERGVNPSIRRRNENETDGRIYLPRADEDTRFSMSTGTQGTPDAVYDDRGERWDGTFRQASDPYAMQDTARETSIFDELPRAELPTVNVKDRFQVLREQAAVPKDERLRAVPREEFTATPAINRLGIRIDGSVVEYGRAESLRRNDAAAKSIRLDIVRAEKRLRATTAEQEFASGISSGIYTEDDVPFSMNKDKVMELADYYMSERALGLDMLREQRREINSRLDERMEELFRDSDQYKPSSAVALYHNTPQRNMREIFGDKLGEQINREVFDPVARNEAERMRFVNRQFDKVRAFEDAKGRMRELSRMESALVQQVIEGRAIAEQVAAMEMGNVVRSAAEDVRNGGSLDDAAREHHLTLEERRTVEKYNRWMDAQELLHSGQVDSVKVENAVLKYRALFDEYYDAINDFLVVHGYEPIGFIKGYAPHMQAEESKKTLEKALQSFGIQTDVAALPTSIAGITSEFKPSKKWNPYFLSRETDTTTYDIASAFESYVGYMSDVLFHTDDIMRLRRMTRHFREKYSRDEIRAKIDWVRTLQNAPTEDKATFLRAEGALDRSSVLSQNAIERAMDEYLEKQFGLITDNTKYGNLVSWIDNYANILAGKQSIADRGFEAEYGRTFLNLGNKLTRAFARAQVAGNLSSALNQTAQLPMILAENGSRNTARAIWDTVSGKVRRAGFSTESDLLAGKRGVRYIVHTPGEMVTTAIFKPAEFVDGFISTVAVRGAYYKALKQGKNHAEAIRAADQYGTEVMASRLKGVKPTAFESKNPLSQMIHMFQVEAVNSWEHIVRDLPRDFHQIAAKQGKGKAALALAGVIVKALLSAFLLNRVAEELYGGTPAPFDILGLTANFIASGEGLSTNAYLRTMIDNAWETYTGERLFDTEELDPNRAFDWGSAFSDLSYNAMNDIPFLRNVSGVLGLGDQTLPLPNLLGGGRALVDAAANAGVLSEETGEALIGLAAEFAPGGRQVKKTTQGVKTMRKGGRIYGYGENERLQYPVEDTAWNWIRAVMFGNSGLGETSSFYASGLSGLSKEQTAVYRELVARGADGGEVFDTIHAMRATETPEEKRNALTASDLSDREKAALYSGIISDSRDESFTAMMQAGMSWQDITEVYNRYAALNQEEGRTASEKATEYANWIDQSRYTSKQKELIKESFQFYSMVPAEVGRYEKFTNAGLSTEDAYSLTQTLANLSPEEGKAQVSNYQRYEAIISSGLSVKDQVAAIGTIMGTELLTESGNPSQYAKMQSALDAGVGLREWLAVTRFEASATTDRDAKGKIVKSAQEKVVVYIDSLPIDDEAKDALYLCYYAKSTLSDTPWRKSGSTWSMADVDWSSIKPATK